MNILVEYKDTSGTIFNQTHRLTRPAFAKHLAIAGQGYAPRSQKLIRTIAMFFHYSYFLQSQAFNNDKFSEPPIQLFDPTEKGQFSNLAGKAIADFLSKRIDQSIFTVNYEAAMKIHNPPIPLTVNGRQVKRPDLLAYTTNSRLAIEAKGFSGGSRNMNNHKNQSRTGGIRVNYTVASVAYNLYKQVKCKYHDPYNDNVPYDEELLRKLTQNYYSGLSEFLNEKYFNYSEVEFQGEKFYEVELSLSSFEKLFLDEFSFRHFWHFKIFKYYNYYYRPRLILPIAIQEYAKNGITNETKPFLFDNKNDNLKNSENRIYIDNDRIGLIIE